MNTRLSEGAAREGEGWLELAQPAIRARSRHIAPIIAMRDGLRTRARIHARPSAKRLGGASPPSNGSDSSTYMKRILGQRPAPGVRPLPLSSPSPAPARRGSFRECRFSKYSHGHVCDLRVASFVHNFLFFRVCVSHLQLLLQLRRAQYKSLF